MKIFNGSSENTKKKWKCRKDDRADIEINHDELDSFIGNIEG